MHNVFIELFLNPFNSYFLLIMIHTSIWDGFMDNFFFFILLIKFHSQVIFLGVNLIDYFSSLDHISDAFKAIKE